jgi:hypothetical protein
VRAEVEISEADALELVSRGWRSSGLGAGSHWRLEDGTHVRRNGGRWYVHVDSQPPHRNMLGHILEDVLGPPGVALALLALFAYSVRR